MHDASDFRIVQMVFIHHGRSIRRTHAENSPIFWGYVNICTPHFLGIQ